MDPGVRQVEVEGGGLATLARMAAAISSQAAVRRAPRTTGWPAWARRRAVAAPIPDDAPVTTVGRRSAD